MNNSLRTLVFGVGISIVPIAIFASMGNHFIVPGWLFGFLVGIVSYQLAYRLVYGKERFRMRLKGFWKAFSSFFSWIDDHYFPLMQLVGGSALLYWMHESIAKLPEPTIPFVQSELRMMENLWLIFTVAVMIYGLFSLLFSIRRQTSMARSLFFAGNISIAALLVPTLSIWFVLIAGDQVYQWVMAHIMEVYQWVMAHIMESVEIAVMLFVFALAWKIVWMFLSDKMAPDDIYHR